MSSGGPGGHPVDADVDTSLGRDPHVTATRASAPAERDVMWPGRCRPTRRERLVLGVLAVLLAGYVAFLAASADWAVHPAIASLAVICAMVALGLLLASAWARRPASSSGGPSVRELPDPTRQALIRELRAGRPGPSELHAYAASWICLNLQAPRTQVLLPALAAMNAGTLAADPGPTPTFELVLLVIVVVAAFALLISWARQRRAADRVADALDQLFPPPPPLPDPA